MKLFYYQGILFFFLSAVLEARIQQLQSDVVIDVQHAKVHFLTAPSSGRGIPSGTAPKSASWGKGDAPKSGQTDGKGASKSQPSRWMEKLSQEEKNKIKKQQRLQQKLLKNVQERPTPKSKSSSSSKGSQMLPATSHKTISTTAKKTTPTFKRSKATKTLSEEIRAALSKSTTTAAAAASKPHKDSKARAKDSKEQLSSREDQSKAVTDARAKEMAEVEELERRLNLQVNKWTSSTNPDRLLELGQGNISSDAQLSLRSYLEACVFIGDFERAHRTLLSQHRIIRRRKTLSIGIYNIVMRVWAKKVRATAVQVTH